jgi:hypothetical protein
VLRERQAIGELSAVCRAAARVDDLAAREQREDAMARTNSLQSKIEQRIAESRDYVFLTREFTDLSGRRQVLRALRKIVLEGRLVRLGCGVYGLAGTSSESERPVLFHPNGFIGAARSALTKLGVAWEPTERELAHQAEHATNPPLLPAVRIRRRFSRRLSFGQTELLVERR